MSEKEINEIISKNLSYYLDVRGITQLELANYLDVSQATISNWCQGIKMPRMKKTDSICRFLNIKRSDLIEEHKEGHCKLPDNAMFFRQDELDLLEKYNRLSDEARLEVLNFIDFKISQASNLREEGVVYQFHSLKPSQQEEES